MTNYENDKCPLCGGETTEIQHEPSFGGIGIYNDCTTTSCVKCEWSITE